MPQHRREGWEDGSRPEQAHRSQLHPALLASTMWNHAPVMWAAIEGAGIEKPKLSPESAADLFAFFIPRDF